MTPEELQDIEARLEANDIPRLAAEVRKLQTLVHLAEAIEDARMEHEISDEIRTKKFFVLRDAEKAFSEALGEAIGRPLVKTERERRQEEANAALRKIEALVAKAEKIDEKGGSK